jgi:hypothetical protein
MHSLKELDDRYNRVNVVGHTMQYHPRDASIGDEWLIEDWWVIGGMGMAGSFFVY